MTEAIRELARLIEEASGFVISDGRFGALEDLARERMADVGSSDIESYVHSLQRHGDSKELRHLLGLITIKESYLYRGRAQFDALADTVLSEFSDSRPDRRLRVWCAGCARGEEAATLAVVLADHPVVGDWRWSILATDVDEAALTEARTGLFGSRAVARVPDDCLQRHFVSRGDRFELDPELRARIEFRRLNLADQSLARTSHQLPAAAGDAPHPAGFSHFGVLDVLSSTTPRPSDRKPHWARHLADLATKAGEKRGLELSGEIFDVIFLRNVLIYFRPEVQRRVISEVENVLAADGSLFLGPSESLLHLDTGLQARELGGSFCYRHRKPVGGGGDSADARREPPPAAAEATMNVVSPPAQPSSPEDAGPTLEARLETVIGCLEKDDLHGALDLIDEFRTGFPENAVAHALEGIARERTGDLDAAILAYRGALYLRPEMDEVRFLLARCLQTLGRTQRAAREYRAVLIGLGGSSSKLGNIMGRLSLPTAEKMIEECRANS